MGFTCGIAVLIFSTQIKDFFGLRVDKLPPDFVDKIKVLLENMNKVDWRTISVAVASGADHRNLARPPEPARSRIHRGVNSRNIFLPLVPCEGKNHWSNSRFIGGIPLGFPKFHFPASDWYSVPEAMHTLHHLFLPAFTIAMLAAIESLLSAVVADGMIDDRHDPNQELMAQGLANIFSPLFGGIPATGAIARTATNVRSSRSAARCRALFMRSRCWSSSWRQHHWPQYIPLLATLSAVLVVVAFNMGEWHQFRRLKKWPKSDSAVFLTVFALTVLTDLPTAVEIGMVLAGVLFINRISETMKITAVDENTENEAAHNSLKGKTVPPGVMVYRVFGAFLFGAADKLETALKRAHEEPEVLILKMQNVLAMDATGLNALEEFYL